MSQQSAIEWTDATWNPVTGCTKVSPGCKHCYAETFAERWRGIPGHPYEQGFDLKLHPDRLELPLHWKKPRRIFVNSMSDLFHEKVSFEFIEKIFCVMCNYYTSHHTFQVLTKRPEKMIQYFKAVTRYAGLTELPRNIWLGVSVENQEYADKRIPMLLKVPAAVRFLSCEPLLGPISLGNLNGIHWVIVGGESGPGARPVQRDWVEDIKSQCIQYDVPFFFKQWGGVRKKEAGRTLGGRTWDEMPRIN